MSRTSKRTRGKKSGTTYRAMLRTGKRIAIQSKRRTSGALLATTFAIAMAVVAIVFGLTLLVITVRGNTVANASGGGPSSGIPSGYGSLNHPKGTCGNAGQAPCAAVDPGWFSLASESPGDVARAITAGKIYVSMQGRFGYVSVDTPTLVRAYNAHTGNSYYDDDHWVVSVRDASGMRCGIFDFVYDRLHQRMRFSSYGVITSLDAHARLAFPYIPSSLAIAKLQSQRGMSMQAGTQPELIFFPIDPNYPVVTSSAHKWAGGGNSAMDPMWHIVGSDGRDYFVGADLNVHLQNDLPIASGQP